MQDDPELYRLKKQAEAAKISDTPAQSIMNPKVIFIYEGSKIYSAVQTLVSNKISGAPVVDSNHKLIGVVTEYDLLLQTATKDVSEVFSYVTKPVVIAPETTLGELIVLFYKKKYRWLPVVNTKGKVDGIVTRIDVLSRLIKKK